MIMHNGVVIINNAYEA